MCVSADACATWVTDCMHRMYRGAHSTIASQSHSTHVLKPEVHGPAFYQSLSRSDTNGYTMERLFLYFPVEPPRSETAFVDWMTSIVKLDSSDPDRFFLALSHDDSGDVVGMLSLMRHQPAEQSIEVGFVMFSPVLQRSFHATMWVHAVMECVFNHLRLGRLEWKCDAKNEASIRAALRFGFQFEALWRHAVVVKQRHRDTAWFALLCERYASSVRPAIRHWMADTRQHEKGSQTVHLADIMPTVSQSLVWKSLHQLPARQPWQRNPVVCDDLLRSMQNPPPLTELKRRAAALLRAMDSPLHLTEEEEEDEGVTAPSSCGSSSMCLSLTARRIVLRSVKLRCGATITVVLMLEALFTSSVVHMSITASRFTNSVNQCIADASAVALQALRCHRLTWRCDDDTAAMVALQCGFAYEGAFHIPVPSTLPGSLPGTKTSSVALWFSLVNTEATLRSSNL